MTKLNLGDIVASEMNTILDSEEHTRLFSTAKKKEEKKEDKDAEKEDKKSKKKEEKSDKKSDKKDEKEEKKSKKLDSDKEEKSDKKAKKDKEKEDKNSDKKEMTSEALDELVNTFTKISHILDESGLVNSSVITLEALDSVIEELAVLKFADCGEMHTDDAEDTNDVKAVDVIRSDKVKMPYDFEAPSDEPVGSLYDEIAELEEDPGSGLVEDLLTDPEAIRALNEKRNNEMLAQELDKPEYAPVSVVKSKPVSIVESEPFDPEVEDVNDAILLEELGLNPLDQDPELSGAVSQKYRDAEKDILGSVESDEPSDTYIDELLDTQLGQTEHPESVIEDIEIPPPPMVPRTEKATIPAKRNLDQIFEDEDVKSAFDKLDNWITKHAHMDEELDIDPDTLSHEEVHPDELDDLKRKIDYEIDDHSAANRSQVLEDLFSRYDVPLDEDEDLDAMYADDSEEDEDFEDE